MKLIKSILLETKQKDIKSIYDSASTEDRKKMLGTKFVKYASRIFNALPTSAQQYLEYGRTLKDPWKVKKTTYHSYGDRKDN